MHSINRRPSGVSLADMILTPSDIRDPNLKLEVGTKFKSVKRAAHSLCLILTKKEQEENKIVDPLMFLDLPTEKVGKKKVNVKVDISSGNIVNV